jgi:predicted HNH restriction endonuclease
VAALQARLVRVVSVVMDSDQRRAWEALPISVCPECHAIVHEDDELAHDIYHVELRALIEGRA